jgi:hypothetical protein
MLFFTLENNKKQTTSSQFHLPWLAMGLGEARRAGGWVFCFISPASPIKDVCQVT